MAAREADKVASERELSHANVVCSLGTYVHAGIGNHDNNANNFVYMFHNELQVKISLAPDSLVR